MGRRDGRDRPCERGLEGKPRDGTGGVCGGGGGGVVSCIAFASLPPLGAFWKAILVLSI